VGGSVFLTQSVTLYSVTYKSGHSTRDIDEIVNAVTAGAPSLSGFSALPCSSTRAQHILNNENHIYTFHFGGVTTPLSLFPSFRRSVLFAHEEAGEGGSGFQGSNGTACRLTTMT
jgi:hypothetical protein